MPPPLSCLRKGSTHPSSTTTLCTYADVGYFSLSGQNTQKPQEEETKEQNKKKRGKFYSCHTHTPRRKGGGKKLLLLLQFVGGGGHTDRVRDATDLHTLRRDGSRTEETNTIHRQKNKLILNIFIHTQNDAHGSLNNEPCIARLETDRQTQQADKKKGVKRTRHEPFFLPVFLNNSSSDRGSASTRACFFFFKLFIK